MQQIEILTLPCNRGRHGSCAGGVSIGIARRRTSCECLCSCHDPVAVAALYSQVSPA